MQNVNVELVARFLVLVYYRLKMINKYSFSTFVYFLTSHLQVFIIFPNLLIN